MFRFGVDVRQNPDLLTPFDRIVIATGARYRFCLGPLANFLLSAGLARRAPLRHLFARPALRDWFYFDARRGADEDIRRLARPFGLPQLPCPPLRQARCSCNSRESLWHVQRRWGFQHCRVRHGHGFRCRAAVRANFRDRLGRGRRHRAGVNGCGARSRLRAPGEVRISDKLADGIRATQIHR